MKKFVADTHAVIWFLGGNKRLSRKAHTIFANALDNRNTQLQDPKGFAKLFWLETMKVCKYSCSKSRF